VFLGGERTGRPTASSFGRHVFCNLISIAPEGKLKLLVIFEFLDVFLLLSFLSLPPWRGLFFLFLFSMVHAREREGKENRRRKKLWPTDGWRTNVLVSSL